MLWQTAPGVERGGDIQVGYDLSSTSTASCCPAFLSQAPHYGQSILHFTRLRASIDGLSSFAPQAEDVLSMQSMHVLQGPEEAEDHLDLCTVECGAEDECINKS